MFNLRRNDIVESETMRYKKIQNIISLLQGNENAVLTETILGNKPSLSFTLGRRIAIDGEKIRIGKQSFRAYEINKVTINTEGSMAIYNNYGEKLCGSLSLNASLDNIELFCVWVRKCNIPIEVISGNRERFFQYAILLITVAVIVLLRIIKI